MPPISFQKVKRFCFRFLLAAAFGWLASFLQELVLTGTWRRSPLFWGEWLYALIYFMLLWELLLRLLDWFPPILQRGALRFGNIFLGLCLAIVGGVCWQFGLGIILELLEKGHWDFTFKAGDQLRFIVLYYVLMIGLNYLAMCTYRILKQFTLVRNANMRSEKAAMEAQLQMLRSQMNPHFLFNSLNIIAATIKSNPDIAYDFTKNMAAFYRKVLESDNVGWVLLQEEMKTIRYYLKMLAIRFEDKLVIELAVTPKQEQQYLVPEFMLQPVVENIIKHNECSRARPLHIVLSVVENGYLEIKNNIQLKDSSQDSLGIGWFNIENRYKYLGAEPPKKYQYNGWYHVHIPLTKSN